MVQKAQLFKGQQKGKKESASRHGKQIRTKKGKLVKPPKSVSASAKSSNEVSKFINRANEAKAVAVAQKDGAVLSLLNKAEK